MRGDVHVMPFAPCGQLRSHTPMGSLVHSVPEMHALYFGPSQCARHCFAFFGAERDSSVLVVDDLSTAMGQTEALVEQAIGEILAGEDDIRAIVLCSACQTVFLGLDLEALCGRIRANTGLYVAHVEANRMSADNIPGPTRKNIPGGDRYHTRLALCSMLEQVDDSRERVRPNGVLVLADAPLAPDNDLLDYTLLDGIDWVRGISALACFDEFLDIRDAALVVGTGAQWREVGEYLERQFGVAYVHAPQSYALDAVAADVAAVDEALAAYGTASQWAELARRRSRRVAEAQQHARRALEACPAPQLDVQAVARPFSLVEALGGHGFDEAAVLRGLRIAPLQVKHRDDGEEEAFGRLCSRVPGARERFEELAAQRGMWMGAGQRTVPVRPVGCSDAEDGQALLESSWWGYSSVCQLMQQLVVGCEQTAASGDARVRAGGQL